MNSSFSEDKPKRALRKTDNIMTQYENYIKNVKKMDSNANQIILQTI